MIPRLVDSVRGGRPVTLNRGGKPTMNPIFVDDVVRIVESALESDGHQLVNVAGDDAATIEEMARSIGRAVDVDPVFEQGDGEAGDIVCSNDRMKRAFSIDDLVPLDTGLARTAAALPAPA